MYRKINEEDLNPVLMIPTNGSFSRWNYYKKINIFSNENNCYYYVFSKGINSKNEYFEINRT